MEQTQQQEPVWSQKHNSLNSVTVFGIGFG